VGNSWWKSEGEYEALVGGIMDSYFGQLQVVYEAGARNFVLLGVPREFSCFPSFLLFGALWSSWFRGGFGAFANG